MGLAPVKSVRCYGQSGQPTGQVPLTGAVHFGPTNTPSGTSQQSIPAAQHSVSQQNSLAGQATPSQGGAPHVPWSQYGWLPEHVLPHAPQLRTSSSSFTHAPLQQENPGPHAGEHVPPPVLELDVIWPMQQARQAGS
jgi:hypothetical protein